MNEEKKKYKKKYIYKNILKNQIGIKNKIEISGKKALKCKLKWNRKLNDFEMNDISWKKGTNKLEYNLTIKRIAVKRERKKESKKERQ